MPKEDSAGLKKLSKWFTNRRAATGAAMRASAARP